jgi:hypothetical protein
MFYVQRYKCKKCGLDSEVRFAPREATYSVVAKIIEDHSWRTAPTNCAAEFKDMRLLDYEQVGK